MNMKGTKTMLEVKNITKYYNTVKAVDNLSFKVKDGEIFGLLGENGAGKTTTFRIIMNLIEANKGTVLLNKEKINYNNVNQIGFVTEERSLLTKLTVIEQLRFYGALKGLSEAEVDKEATKWLTKFAITDYKNRKIKELSKGNQQKIQFISAIIGPPKLLILDEPFTGLDPINVKIMKEAIYELQKTGTSIIFSSHQMEYIEDFCEQLIILVKGHPVVSGSIKKIKEDFQIKNIIIKGENLPIDEIKQISGVLDIIIKKEELEVKLEDISVAPLVFSKIKDCNITKYELQEPSLNEIFIAKVGGSNND